ncbi:MAG: glutamine amidotransferase [Symploca sp. SIO2B6]|nr:glutamine amidotransferase [Symploca sp. SIO2B6]
MQSKQATVIRHLAFEDLGTLAPVLNQAGYSIKYLEAGQDNLQSIEFDQPDLLIILGGPIGAYEEKDYPFLLDELRILSSRFQADLPVLGICLGSQLMARALGASVYPSGSKEIGWSPITLTTAGQKSPLRFLSGEYTSMFHWHGDTFDLPAQSTLLASTPVCKHQAFMVGENSLGLQFHPEVTPLGLERWFIGHAVEIGATETVKVSQLRADTVEYGKKLEEQASAFWSEWVSGLDGGSPLTNLTKQHNLCLGRNS